MSFEVSLADPEDPSVEALLDRHFALMRSQSPPESCHVLPSDDLKATDVTVFSVREGVSVLGVGALKLAPDYGELKSMHTAFDARGRGVGAVLVEALVGFARANELSHVCLETGSGSEHAAARRLYRRAGFSECPPFGEYRYDPLSTFMIKAL